MQQSRLAGQVRYNTYMTQISRSNVQQLAQLSGLQLDDAEVSSLMTDLDAIVGYIEQLGELDTTGVEPTYQVTDLQNVYREDVVIDYGVSREQLLNLAPAHADNQVKVPKVL